MQMKHLVLTIATACMMGWTVQAATPAESAKESADAATASASKAAALVADGQALLAAMDKGIADCEARIKELEEKGDDAAALAKARDELTALKETRARAERMQARLEKVSEQAAAAAAAAQDALARATAEGVSEADAKAAADEAARQAGLAAAAQQSAARFLALMSHLVKTGGFAPLIAGVPVGDPTVIGLIPEPGPTPTPIGSGRRGK